MEHFGGEMVFSQTNIPIFSAGQDPVAHIQTY